ncbi:MAG TPA: methyltransferase domain-containing protein [Burkholderiaceae bacterium]|nr:methyltransferase domain-containing protein [Burkholderiaceae bacterium]
MTTHYVHGYRSREKQRLQDQADTLLALLHRDTRYPAGSSVLEAGCGVGAQTLALVRNSPQARITSIDVSAESIVQARRRIEEAGVTNVVIREADILALPFEPRSFDHVFVCFVLEHVPTAALALERLVEVLRPGGSLTVIEGDHGSTLFHPDSAAARASIDCLVQLQRRAGGDALIGRRLYPLLAQAGLETICVEPRIVYADASRPAWVDGFTNKTFIAMVEGVRDDAVAAGLISADRFDAGLRDLRRATEADGAFCYTFFKGVARKAGLKEERA